MPFPALILLFLLLDLFFYYSRVSLVLLHLRIAQPSFIFAIITVLISSSSSSCFYF